MLTLFDAHCHLDPHPQNDFGFSQPEQSDQPVAVRGRLLCGVGMAETASIEAAARSWPGTLPAFGVHPWHAAETENGAGWLDEIEAALERAPASWVGEIGLDGLRTERSETTVQEAVFRDQLRLAKRLNRSVNLHCVKAWSGLVAALDETYLTGGARPFIVHSFAGPYQFIAALAERGAYFSVGQLAARHDSRKGRERVALLPSDRLLLESDSFLSPGRDDLAELDFALSWLAEVRVMSRGALAVLLEENVRRVLGAG